MTNINKAIASLISIFVLLCDIPEVHALNFSLSPELSLTSPRYVSQIRADLICELIEKRASQWQDRSIEHVYYDDMLKWKKTTSPLFEALEIILSVDKTEIQIFIPGSGILIRYYDTFSGRNRNIINDKVLTELETKVINNRINRQIFEYLPAESSIYEQNTRNKNMINESEGIELVFFDWDGTIVETTGRSLDNFIMLNRSLFNTRDEAIVFEKKYLHGKTVPETFLILKAYADAKNLEFPYEDAIQYGNELDLQRMAAIGENISVIKGSIDFIKRLRQSGVHIHICSAMNIRGLEEQIKKIGLAGLVDGVHGSPSSREDEDITKAQYIEKVIKKGSFTRAGAFMFGDTMFDMQAALLTGITGIGIAGNNEKEEELSSFGALFNVSDYEVYDQIVSKMRFETEKRRTLAKITPDVLDSIKIMNGLFDDGDLSKIDHLIDIAKKLEPSQNDILMAEPVQKILLNMPNVVRALSQADMLLKIDEIALYCSEDFIEKNISPEILIKSYLNRQDYTRFASRASLGPIIGKALEGRTPKQIKDDIIIPLAEAMEKDLYHRYKYCDLFSEISGYLSPEINDVVFPGIVKTLMQDMRVPDHEKMKALNQIFNNSNILQDERNALRKGTFDPDNELLVKLNYILWSKRFHRGNFEEFPKYDTYLKSIKNNLYADDLPELESELLRDTKAVVYEAYLAREKILQISFRAEELDRKLIVLENLSYGAVSLAPVTEERVGNKYITGTDIRVISTKIASSGEQEILTSLLPFDVMREIGQEQPIIIVVDGTTNIINSEGRSDTVRLPSAFSLGYKKYFMAVNKALKGEINPDDFHSKYWEIDKIQEDKEFKRLELFFSYFKTDRDEAYKTFFWYPGELEIITGNLSSVPKIRDVNDLKGASFVFMQTVNDPGSVDIKGREYIGGEYAPGGFDDKGCFKGVEFVYDGHSPPKLLNYKTEISRRMFSSFCREYDVIYDLSPEERDEELIRKTKTLFEEKFKKSSEDKFFEDSDKVLRVLLKDSNKEILLRVPVEFLRASEKENIGRIISYLNRFQRAENGYVEVFYISGTVKLTEEEENIARRLYSIEKKDLPSGFEKTNKNTVTLFAFLDGQELDIRGDPVQSGKDLNKILASNLGYLPVRKTQIVPIGLRDDPAGILRGTIIGLQMIYIARYNEYKKDLYENMDKEFISRFVDPAVRKYKELCLSCGIREFNFTGEDLIFLAVGSLNDRIRSLKKLVQLIPIGSFDPEGIRRVYEYAESVLLFA